MPKKNRELAEVSHRDRLQDRKDSKREAKPAKSVEQRLWNAKGETVDKEAVAKAFPWITQIKITYRPPQRKILVDKSR